MRKSYFRYDVILLNPFSKFSFLTFDTTHVRGKRVIKWELTLKPVSGVFARYLRTCASLRASRQTVIAKTHWDYVFIHHVHIRPASISLHLQVTFTSPTLFFSQKHSITGLFRGASLTTFLADLIL